MKIYIKTDMKEIPADCNQCDFLQVKEAEQKFGEPHVCIITKQTVRHLGYHPQLPRPDWCPLVKEEDIK